MDEDMRIVRERGCRNDDDLFRCLVEWYREDFEHVSKWRKHAREDFNFYNGDQWDEADLARMALQKRPPMTFNRIAPLINAIVGSERNNKREVQFIPRQIGDAIPSDLLTGAAEWFRQESDAETADSEAFRDMVVCGMGWTETRLDDRDNPEGKPYIRCLDPLKMVWDKNATAMNLSDVERVWYVETKPFRIAHQLFPDVDKKDLHADWAETGVFVPDDEGTDRSGLRRYVTLVECRWFEPKRVYRAADIGNLLDSGFVSEGGLDVSFALRDALSTADLPLKDYDESEFGDICRVLGCELPHVVFKKRVVNRAFLGRCLLEPVSCPSVPSGQLGWECITGYYHKTENHFYGIVRPTKDPQRWANKYFSQVMHILNSQAKGGLLAERGAFEDEHQAAESYARADGITIVRDGALAGKKIQPKPKVEYPSGFMQLFLEAKEAINDVTGISEEFMGVREVNQAGVLEAQRRQSSLNLLASLFDSLRLYRQRQGRLILHLLQHDLSDGRLVKIHGEENAHYIELTKDKVLNVEYDIIVDDAPMSPNEKERTFSNFVQLLPLLKDVMSPDILLEFLKYSPLPSPLVNRLSERVNQQMQMQMEQIQADQASGAGVEIDPEKQLRMARLAQDMESRTQMNDVELKSKQAELASKLQEMIMNRGMIGREI